MTVHLFIARLRAGTVGEIQRVVHQFTVPDDLDNPPAEVTAFCGQSFNPTRLELLTHISGMPCEACLVVAPKPATEVDRGVDPIGIVRHAVDYLEWWLPVNERTAGTQAVAAINTLMGLARHALSQTEGEETL